MSGEVNYRNFAGTPGKNPKYLSDSLAPWYGNWSPNIPGELSIDYTGLPTGECLARLIQTGFIGNRHLMFEFSQPQNIFGLTFETYVKESLLGSVLFYVSRNPVATWLNEYLRWSAGISPGVAGSWVKRTLTMDKGGWDLSIGITTNPNVILTRVKTMVIYSIANCGTFEVSGFNLRRL